GKAFAEALYINTTLTDLILRATNIGIEGGKALAKAFYKNNTLIFLRIFIGNEFDYEDIGLDWRDL
ncbi:12095_t:CDS:1, partial [Cetraspora pellucida]